MTSAAQFCTFFLDGLCFGIEVRQVQEVLRYQEMTRAPLASSVVAGLINLRGQIVTAIDLRRRLELPERSSDNRADKPPMNVVVRTGAGSVSFLVDAIGEVIEPAQSSFEEPPPTLPPAARSLVRGAYKLDERLLLVLDAARCAELSTESVTIR